MPDDIAETVFLPITSSCLVIAILGNLAAAECKALIDKFTPGAITPPRYTPPCPTTSKVVAVPKSIITEGFLYKRHAQRALTILSVPISDGTSNSVGKFTFISSAIT